MLTINGLVFDIREYVNGKHLMVFLLSMAAIDTQIHTYIAEGTPDQQERAQALLPLYQSKSLSNGDWNPVVAAPVKEAIIQGRTVGK